MRITYYSSLILWIIKINSTQSKAQETLYPEEYIQNGNDEWSDMNGSIDYVHKDYK